MNELPEPFVPVDCDLRDFPFMPVDILRLFGSDFHAQSNDTEWRAGMTLWLRSYHQVPAGSLPDDEIALTRLAELGRDLKGWRKIAIGALRGWIKCGDGRLYHRTVCEKALEGWIEKLLQRKSSEAGNAKRYGHPFDATPFETAIETSLKLLAALNPQSRVLKKRAGKSAIGIPGGAPGGSPDEPPTRTPGGSPEPPPDDLPHHSQETGTETSKISPSLRSGETRASASRSSPTSDHPKRSGSPRGFPSAAFDRWYAGYPHKVGRGAAEKAFARVMAAGEVALDELITATDRYVRTKNPEHAWCNPATWLNQRRWLDQPASSLSAMTSTSLDDPRIEFGGGVQAPYSTIRGIWSQGRWVDAWGPRPGEPGCRISDDVMASIMASPQLEPPRRPH